jgi:hypothetical protein
MNEDFAETKNGMVPALGAIRSCIRRETLPSALLGRVNDTKKSRLTAALLVRDANDQ